MLADLSDNSTNVALAAAAAVGAVGVTAANEAVAVAAGLAKLYDVRGRDLAWALATFNGSAGFSFSRTVTTLQLAAKTCCMGDFSIATGALQWWQDDVASPLATQVWQSLQPGAFAMLGWGPDEYNTVTGVSQLGGVVIASDWASNMDVLSMFDVPSFRQKAQQQQQQRAVTSPPSPAAPVHTATFLMSDGDNLQFILGGFATAGSAWFGSADRGKVPMGWTLSPSAADLAPSAMAYLYGQASDGSTPEMPFGDVFVAGVSGAGYYYPDSTASAPGGSALLSSVANLTHGYVRKAGMRIVNILGHGEGYGASDVAPILASPDVDAVFWYNFDDYSGMRGNITFVGGKPVIGGRFNLWGNGTDPEGPTFCNNTLLVERLLAMPRDPTTSSGYSLIPLHAWSHNVTDALMVMEMLNAQAPGAVEIVTPDVFVARIVANLAPST